MKKVFLIAASVFFIQVSFSQPVSELPPQKIKLLSWNIYMIPGIIGNGNCRRGEAIGNILASSDYDVIVFQEAFCPWARKKIRQALSERFPYQAGPANRRFFSLKTNSGLWIWSRYPIVRSQSIVYHARHGIDALSRKGGLLVELNVSGQIIQVAATHLQNSGREQLRHLQCQEFFDLLLKPNEREGVPQIICGDFNIRQNSEHYKFMLKTLEATDGALAGDKKFTYDRINNDLHVEKGSGQDLIDYVLLRNNRSDISAINRRIVTIQKQWTARHKDLSDHYSLQADIPLVNFSGIVSRGER
jgi:endonuclease/exonuclease/phosphatase family metal-dependent hydrolase